MESPRTRGIFTKSWSENNGDLKDEFTAVGFRSGASICTCESNCGRGNNTEKKQYQSLLNVNGEQLTDPFTELKDNWIGEEKGVEKWPPIQLQLLTDTNGRIYPNSRSRERSWQTPPQ